MGEWSFLTNHARVLVCIARDPGVRLREIADVLGVTERRAFGIVNDLTKGGYVVKQKDGRRNRYRIQNHLPLPAPIGREPTIGGLVALACASPIITAIGSSIVKHNGSWSFLPAVWFVTLGIAIALLIAMLVLVIFEALVPSGTMPGPLYLIRGLHKRARRVRRYSQIGRILVRRGMLPYLRGTRRSELQTHDGREQLAGSLRLALEDGSVTFIKLGQLLATRRDLLPAEFIDELSGLQDNAAQVPRPQVQEVLRSELGADVDDVFESFDRAPLAAASIAQVHSATLSSGQRVVVKVRRRGIDTIVAWDLDIVDRLAIRLQRSTRWARSRPPRRSAIAKRSHAPSSTPCCAR